MTRAWMLLALFPLAGCQKNTPTPPGTEAFHWTKSMATRPSVPKAKELGPRVTKDVTLHVTPDLRGPLLLKLHLETAPVEIVEEETRKHTAPVDVKVTVETNDDWTVSGKCSSGPDYRFGDIGPDGKMAAPEAMVLHCSIDLRYVSTMKDLQEGVSLELDGAGKVTADFMSGKVVVE